MMRRPVPGLLVPKVGLGRERDRGGMGTETDKLLSPLGYDAPPRPGAIGAQETLIMRPLEELRLISKTCMREKDMRGLSVFCLGY